MKLELTALGLLLCATTAIATEAPYASSVPIAKPALFEEGVISTQDFESHPAFTPDGRTLYFVKSTPAFSFWTIVVSRFVDGQWTTPEVAPFSGRYSDADPYITRDGKQLYFISNRPTPDKAARDLDIWVMDRADTGWSEPRRLPAPANSAGNEWFPTLAADGTLYLGSDRPGGQGATDLWRCRRAGAGFAAAENLGATINTATDEYEPWITADQQRLFFMASGRADAHGGSADLYVSDWKDGAWTAPRNLGDAINSNRDEYSPTISPDGRYFFFASARGRGSPPQKAMRYADLLEWLRGPLNGLGNIYRVDLNSVAPVDSR
jgi:Tol biopolymer transport system component